MTLLPQVRVNVGPSEFIRIRLNQGRGNWPARKSFSQKLQVSAFLIISKYTIANGRYIDIPTWHEAFRTNFCVLLPLYLSLFWILRDKRNFKNFDPKASEPCWNVDRSSMTCSCCWATVDSTRISSVLVFHAKGQTKIVEYPFIFGSLFCLFLKFPEK